MDNSYSRLDAGPVVPQGSMERYVQAGTVLNLTPDQMYTGRFGNETLPRRFELPMRKTPCSNSGHRAATETPCDCNSIAPRRQTSSD